MSDDSNALSQEQIDALLSGGDDVTDESAAEESITEPAAADVAVEAPAESGQSGAEDLTQAEKDAIGEIGNISMGTAATTLATLLNKAVEITTPQVRVQRISELKAEYPDPTVLVSVEYVEGFKGNNVLFLKQEDAAVMASLMMGGDGKPEKPELDEMQLSAISESMNQMAGTAATSMATMVEKSINIASPKVKIADIAAKDLADMGIADDLVVTVTFNMTVEGLIDSKLVQIQPLSFARELVESLVNKHAPEPEELPPVQSAPQAQAPAQPAAGAAPQAPPMMAAAPQAPAVEIQRADFPEFSRGNLNESESRNLDILLDVTLQVTAELGRTRMAVKDILELGPGAVIELERFAGEPIDVLVNNRLMARAEVVVIDESFGVRITEIISPEERLERLSKEKE